MLNVIIHCNIEFKYFHNFYANFSNKNAKQ